MDVYISIWLGCMFYYIGIANQKNKLFCTHSQRYSDQGLIIILLRRKII
ncbi:unnamed protein product [Spodoptera littoralis]|uniref:Uncharacterized protein n=1 Tax=Spodoptera littoralis TaxID=7109 RepID=A0A9P0IE92_SPOLI|nr:unnamed protein product [Spodoptera littoralis]CAH1643575.1 unnamed protein product [Spodoptera littoralis]